MSLKTGPVLARLPCDFGKVGVVLWKEELQTAEERAAEFVPLPHKPGATHVIAARNKIRSASRCFPKGNKCSLHVMSCESKLSKL